MTKDNSTIIALVVTVAMLAVAAFIAWLSNRQ